jgi:hypothetical protein
MGHRCPGPGRQISRGGILKKMEIEVWYAGKKRLSTREKFKGDPIEQACQTEGPPRAIWVTFVLS